MGLAEGRAEGREYQMFLMIRRKMIKGCSAGETADILEEDPEHVGKVYEFLRDRTDQSEEESWKEWIRLKKQGK